MYSRILNYSTDRSFFLFGPRGTGKTTWVKHEFKGSVYVDLLEAQLFNRLLANPQRLENYIPLNFNNWIIIDEIQRVPELLNEVHRLIEKYNFKFILTGSNARKLRKRGTNLLAGRAFTNYMHPLSAVELKNDFILEKSLKYGHLPDAYQVKDPQRYLDSYVMTYLEQEIKQEGLSRNLNNFSRFLEAASFSQGSVLNISEVARECSIERKTVGNYFNILTDLLVGYRIPVFTRKSKRRMISHEKFYFFDTGIFRTIRPKGPLDKPEQIDGAAGETLILQELIATNDSYNLGYKIFFWRTSNNLEVDFVLYGQKGLKAFEVKRTDRLSKSMFKGLKAFLKDYPQSEAFFIYGGNNMIREGNINILPFDQFLKNLPGILNNKYDDYNTFSISEN
ncbi:MAG: ATPase [Desulfuromonas sp. SDB]|nr:MAG: ATPase [Desulfuromonas sp. SDB]